MRFRYFKKVEKVEFDNPFVMDRTAFLGNMRSRSYTPVSGSGDFERFYEELDKVFQLYAQDGSVAENMKTEIFFGSF